MYEHCPGLFFKNYYTLKNDSDLTRKIKQQEENIFKINTMEMMKKCCKPAKILFNLSTLLLKNYELLLQE